MRRRDWFLWIGGIYLLALLLVAIFGPTFRHDYLTPVGRPLLDANDRFWLGTDEQGRDLFSRIAYGARMSLVVGLSVQGMALFFGILVGVLGTFAPVWIRTPLLRLTDAMFAFPDILLAILLIGILQLVKFPEGSLLQTLAASGVVPVIVALGIGSWPSIARLVITQLATLKDREFVVASKAAGAGTFYLVTRHILPQLWGILMAVAMINLAATILAESTLSFLGIGIQAPIPSWGSIINNARTELNSHPMQLFWPCLVLSMTIFALNFVGDGLRAMLDPKGR